MPEFPAASRGFHSSVKLLPLSILATTLAHPPGGLEADLATKNTGGLARTDGKAPILWPPDVKSQLTGKTLMQGQEGKGETEIVRQEG